jgi:hypothetical protein
MREIQKGRPEYSEPFHVCRFTFADCRLPPPGCPGRTGIREFPNIKGRPEFLGTALIPLRATNHLLTWEELILCMKDRITGYTLLPESPAKVFFYHPVCHYRNAVCVPM